jgi:YD repeat-containing protein
MNEQTSLSVMEYPTAAAACTASAVVWPTITDVSYRLQSQNWPYYPANQFGTPYAGGPEDRVCSGRDIRYPNDTYYYNLYHPWPEPHCPLGYFANNPNYVTPCQLWNANLVFKPKTLGSLSSCKSCGDIPGTPHPIHAGTGNKYVRDTDYHPSAVDSLRFIRHYNSQNTSLVRTLGTSWKHHYDSTITNGTNTATVARPDGKSYLFNASGSAYIAQDADVDDKLNRILDASGNPKGWKYTVDADGSVEEYDAEGKLVSIQNRNGTLQSLVYSDGATPATVAAKAGLLIRVTDNFGRYLTFTYDRDDRIATMTDPEAGLYQYRYDINGNLATVIYPGGKSKGYLYSESTYSVSKLIPSLLTGIVDENTTRYASHWYDAEGRAYKEQHAGGVDQYQLAYGTNSTVITDPMGAARTYNLNTILGLVKSAGQSQPGGSGSGPASSAITYDANGNVASTTDFNGTVTQYTYDLTRNLETSRIEGFGTPQARTITTQWHATYRLPVKIAEPNRLTTFVYDASGNLLTKSIQATNDATGAQGVSAPAVGVARTWTYTYNTVGQVLTATGPRTDVVDRTTYTYDAHGRAGRITDPNGITTDMSYSARGWLTSRVVSGAGGGAETTSYDYDGIGQMTKATLPDGSAIFYTYDPAHRLTAITDSLGNSMTYTLDAMGNRTNEQVKDPNGTLARQTSRIYDALNRLQQVTGGGVQ